MGRTKVERSVLASGTFSKTSLSLSDKALRNRKATRSYKEVVDSQAVPSSKRQGCSEANIVTVPERSVCGAPWTKFTELISRLCASVVRKARGYKNLGDLMCVCARRTGTYQSGRVLPALYLGRITNQTHRANLQIVCLSGKASQGGTITWKTSYVSVPASV